MAAMDLGEASLTQSSISSNETEVEKQGATKGTSSGDICERLPEALVELILAKLPFSSLFRFCCVCKKWRDLILSGHTILYFNRGQLIVRTSMRRVWETVPLPFLGLDQPSSLHLVASAGGLLCFCTSMLGEFIICNPLTQDYKRLPLMLSAEVLANNNAERNFVISTPSNARLLPPLLTVGMIMKSDSKSFKLIVASMFYVSPRTTFSPRTTMVYDSQTDSWKKVSEIPQGQGIIFRLKPMVCNGHLYCSLYGPSTGDMLLKYEVDQERWSLVSIPESLGIPCKFMELDGKLVFMTINQPFPGGFGFFELQDSEFTVWQSSNSLLLTKVREAMTFQNLDNRPVSQRPIDCREWSTTGCIECFGNEDVLCFMGKSVSSKAWASRSDSKLCIRVWIHNILRNSDTISDWEEWQLGEGLLYDYCQLFKLSTLSCS